MTHPQRFRVVDVAEVNAAEPCFGGDDSPIVVGVVRQNVQARRGDVDQQLHGVRR